MSDLPVLVHGITGEVLLSTSRRTDGDEQEVRLAARGEQYVMNLWNGLYGLAQEGSLWVATTATPGTGITASVATGTSFSDTQALLVIDNMEQSPAQGGQGRRIYLDTITLVITATGTATTVEHIAHRLDLQRRGSGGTQLGATGVLPQPVSSDMGGNSVARILFGNPTVVAASVNVRNLGHNVIRAAAAPAWIAGDCIKIKYGSQEEAAGGVSVSATTASMITVFAPPVMIAPGHSYVLNEWGVSRSAAFSAECMVTYIER